MFSPENAPDLKGKPKIFLVQVCKGDADSLLHDGPAEGPHFEPKLCDDHDYCWNYAATPGNLATRGLMFHTRAAQGGKEQAEAQRFRPFGCLQAVSQGQPAYGRGKQPAR